MKKKKQKNIKIPAIDLTRAMGIDVFVYTDGNLKPKKLKVKNNMFELKDEFDNGHYDHFTHYDYLVQLVNNGQPSEFRKHLEGMSNRALVSIGLLKMPYSKYLNEEILKRMK
jgi:hypothetical protein